MFLLNLFIWIITLIIFYNLIRVAVREAIFETKNEIIHDLKEAITEAMIQAGKESKEDRYKNVIDDEHRQDR